MAKRTSRSKKSVRSLPKGLPVRAKTDLKSNRAAAKSASGNSSSGNNNPFEAVATQRRPKFAVHNRPISTARAKAPSALAAAIQQRQSAISAAFKQQRKSNVFSDKRIGEAGNGPPGQSSLPLEERNVQRLVRERARQSKRTSKFSLSDDGEEDILTHKGKAIDSLTAADHVMLSDEEEGDLGNLDAYDTEMHFGGYAQDQKDASVYGAKGTDISTTYSQKKTDLDDLIMRRKLQKQERLKSKETQVDKFEAMDNQFSELATLLKFRDKEQDIRNHIAAKREGTLSAEDQELAEWDKEMKQYLHIERKVAATDRTKTPEEIAKEEADRLHELETRRLARMNGDFDDGDDDDLDADDSLGDDDDGKKKSRAKSHKRRRMDHPEILDNDSDDEGNSNSKGDLTTRFSAEGLVYVDKDSVAQGKVGDAEGAQKYGSEEEIREYSVGDKVRASYRATEQFDGHESWFTGKIVNVVREGKKTKYNIEYVDGDFEDGVEPRHIRPIETTLEEIEAQNLERERELKLKRKRQMAIEKARYANIFLQWVFWVYWFDTSRLSTLSSTT
jgi:nucleolar protein 14